MNIAGIEQMVSHLAVDIDQIKPFIKHDKTRCTVDQGGVTTGSGNINNCMCFMSNRLWQLEQNLKTLQNLLGGMVYDESALF